MDRNVESDRHLIEFVSTFRKFLFLMKDFERRDSYKNGELLYYNTIVLL